MTPTSRLFRPRHHPYYVWAPDYTRTSAGIRVMHQLCDALNQLGEEAYITTKKTNSSLNTPVLTDEIRTRHLHAGLRPIAIYPEIIGDNPLKCGIVVRYILNKPGMLGQQPAYQDEDIIYIYVEELRDHVENACAVMTLPTVDCSIFNNLDNPSDNKREGACIYFGRFVRGREVYSELAARCTEITKTYPPSHVELAELFRRSEALYCFENTSVSLEANLCGCPTVLLPSPYVDRNQTFTKSLGFAAGTTFDDADSAVERARMELPQVAKHYAQLEESFWIKLSELIVITQKKARELSAMPGPHPEINAYTAWLATQAPSDADAQILAERMILRWTQRPAVHLLMAVRQGDHSLMVETLGSLGAQLYPDWRLTVVSDLPAPEGWQEGPNLQWLALRDAVHIDYVIDEMAATSSSDWITRIAPGVTLAAHALLLIADHLQRHPDWRLLYTDEDLIAAQGVHAQPRFKPDFNLEYLRASNYLGSLVLIRKDAFLDAGRYGPHTGAQNYDMALRIADMAGPRALGHVPGMLAHANAQSLHACSLAAESAALHDHLRRNDLIATIHDGLEPNARRLHYAWPQPPRISVVLAVHDELEFVHPLLGELKTLSDVEVLVMDVGDRDPDMRSFLDEQKVRPDWRGRLRVLDTAPNAWPQAAASAACGEFLFLLDSHITAPKAADLATLGALVQCPGTGAVAPRLVQAASHGLVMNGDWSLAGHGHVALVPNESGPLGLSLCTHSKLAVSRLPLLVRKSVFMAAGGLDLNQLTLSDALIDLCIRLTQAGHALLWTPHVTLTHLGGEDGTDRTSKAGFQHRSSRVLLQRHLRALVHDTTRHPLLSPDRPDQVDHAVPLTWTDEPGAKPRILLLVTDGESQGTGFYETAARWQRDAEVLLITVDLRTQSLSPLSVAKWMPDALVLHTTIAEPVQKLLEEIACMLPEVQRVVRLDSLDFLSTPKGTDITAARPLLRKLFHHATKVIVPTQELAALCSGLVEQIVVHESLESLSASEWLGYSVDGRRSGSTVSEPTTMS